MLCDNVNHESHQESRRGPPDRPRVSPAGDRRRSVAPPALPTNRGYWSLRVPVQIFNEGTNAALGEPLTLPVGQIAGTRAESLRVCDANGQELLFDIAGAGGETKRTGRLVGTDRLVIPAECSPKGSATIYVYAGNDAAMGVPDFFRYGLLNGGFESGAESPEEWSSAVTDALHSASWEKTGGHGDGRCVKSEVGAAAQPTWVQWRQTGIPLRPVGPTN